MYAKLNVIQVSFTSHYSQGINVGVGHAALDWLNSQLLNSEINYFKGLPGSPADPLLHGTWTLSRLNFRFWCGTIFYLLSVARFSLSAASAYYFYRMERSNGGNYLFYESRVQTSSSLTSWRTSSSLTSSEGVLVFVRVHICRFVDMSSILIIATFQNSKSSTKKTKNLN